MLFAVQTFFGTTMEMSGPEMGLYLISLNYAWTKGARLTADEESLRRTFRYEKEEWTVLWPTVSKKWTRDGQYLKNNKLSILYAAAWNDMVRSVENGRKGGNAKAANARAGAYSARGPTTHPTSTPTGKALAKTESVAIAPAGAGINSSLTPTLSSISEEKEISGKRKRAERFHPPSVEEIQTYADEKGWPKAEFNPAYFFESYGAKGWMIGKSPMKDWHLAAQKAHREGWTVLKQDRAAQPDAKRKIGSLAEVTDGRR